MEGRPLDDRELIASAQNGDTQAFEQLVRIHQGIALRVAHLGDGPGFRTRIQPTPHFQTFPNPERQRNADNVLRRAGWIHDWFDADVIEVDFEPQLGYPRMIFVQADSGFTEMSVMTFTPGEADTLPAEEILAQLREQRKIWGDEGTSDYTITVEIGCFCPEEFRGPFEVTVVDGNVDAITMNGEVAESVDEAFLTVEGLFSTIEDYAYSDEITVTYSPEGYPQTIDIDPSRNTIDEELRIDVLDLITSP